MLGLADVRDYIASLGIAEDKNVYMGKLDSKPDKAIGIYQRQNSYKPRICIGSTSSFEKKPISLLVHWNKSARETEKQAFLLYQKLTETVMPVEMGDTSVFFIDMLNTEPVDVATDDNGVYERVIEFDLYYRKE